MIAGVINLCGAFGGDMSGPQASNKKGMFENTVIRGSIVKPYLKQIGADPMAQYPLPDINNMMIPRDWKQRVEAVMHAQGYKDGPWMYKGPKMGLMWPVWHFAFPNAKWIIVRRRTGDIVDSCIKTGFMRAFANPATQKAVGAKDEREGWIWWVNQHLNRFIEMISEEEGPNCKQIWPHRMINADYKQLYQTMDWLGLDWKSEALDFIDPMLWHGRKHEKQPNHGHISNG
jgi:hypothetical protein